MADKRHADLRETPQADLFLPIAQMTEPWLRSWFVVRGRVNAVGLLPAIQNAVASVDPAVAIGSFATMETRMANSVAPDRFRAWLVGVLAALALTLAVLGIYGLLAWTVARETRDIGIRAALGQSPPLAVARVVQRALVLAGTGLVLGLAFALAAARVLSGFLAGITPQDPLSALLVSVAILSFAVLASAGPAWRASRVDPLVALRSE